MSLIFLCFEKYTPFKINKIIHIRSYTKELLRGLLIVPHSKHINNQPLISVIISVEISAIF